MDTKPIRERVLSLAIQGKLLPQDATDEPASVLLERIRKERADLIKQKKIKAPKNESVIFRGEDGLFYERVGKSVTCIQDEIPFEIPSSWEWVRLGEIANNRDAERIPLSQKQREERKKIYDYYGASGVIDKVDDYLFDEPLLLIGEDGANLLTRSKPIAFIAHGKYWVNNHAHILGLFASMPLDYLELYINAISLAPYVTGSAQPKMNQKKMNSILVPLAPLDEQKRICTSIENILANVDEIEKNQIAIESDFKRLKEKALDLAIRGKLLPQNPDDEPASELLERIRKEKQALIKAKKIKAPKQESVIYRKDDGSFYERIGKTEICIDDEIPFDIPISWEWVRLKCISNYIQRGKSPKYSPIKRYPVIAQKCNQWSGFSIEKAQFIDPDTISKYTEERILKDNDLLWNSTGLGTVGRMAIYKDELNPFELAVADSHVTVIRLLSDYIIPEYVYSYIASPTMQLMIGEKSSGSTKQKELNLNTVIDFLIPIPSLNEQMRICEILNQVVNIHNR